MHTPPADPSRPSILLTEAEAEALSNLACAPAHRNREASRLLLEEIDRAQICSDGELPDEVVTMGSFVSFVDETTGAAHVLQLVYPKDADMSANRISILTPVGAGLIGLRTGQSIDWPDRSGALHRLKIVEVKRVAQAAL